jgi:acyl-CoA thioester hydrolase
MRRHRYDCQVRFSDVDVYGHVNNVKYFEYYQEARLAFLTSLSDERPADEPPFGVVVARLDVDYLRPILFRAETYAVESWVTDVGRSSFRLAAEIVDDGLVLSRATAVMVAYDVERQAARPLTEWERQRLGELLILSPRRSC